MPIQQPTNLTDEFGEQYEHLLIWLLLYNREVSDRISGRLDASLFGTDATAMLIDTMYDCRARYNGTTTSTMLEAELRNRLVRVRKGTPIQLRVDKALALLKTVNDRPTPTNTECEYALDSLTAFVTRRAVHNALLDGAAKYTSGEYDEVVTLVTEAAQAGQRLVTPSIGLEALKGVLAKIERYKDRMKLKQHVPLNIPLLDAKMRGGLEPGMLGMFMGPTGSGKTLSLVHAGAAAIANGENVVHITLEIDQDETEVRYDASMTGIPINDLLATPSAYISNLRKMVRRARGRLFVQSWGSSEASVGSIRAYLDTLRLAEGVQPGLVIVDYADLLVPTNRSQNTQGGERRFELGKIIRELRQVAADYSVPVWTASQTGRNSFTSLLIKLSDVAECLEKVQVADVVIGLCQTEGEKKQKLIRLRLLKNRLGGDENKVVDCNYQASKQRITQRAVQVFRADVP
jgi:replicative DNA helicase